MTTAEHLVPLPLAAAPVLSTELLGRTKMVTLSYESPEFGEVERVHAVASAMKINTTAVIFGLVSDLGMGQELRIINGDAIYIPGTDQPGLRVCEASVACSSLLAPQDEAARLRTSAASALAAAGFEVPPGLDDMQTSGRRLMHQDECKIKTGCTVSYALNYVPLAVVDDGSCYVLGCCDSRWPDHYNALANFEDGSCPDFVFGCTDPTAANYRSEANADPIEAGVNLIEFPGCEYAGCQDSAAKTYNPTATLSVPSRCVYSAESGSGSGVE